MAGSGLAPHGPAGVLSEAPLRRPTSTAAQLLVVGPARRDPRGYPPLSSSSVGRHRRHIAPTIAKAHDAEVVAHADNLLGQVRDLHGRALAILENAEAEGRPTVALQAIRECRATLELAGKVTGELVERHAHLHAHAGPLIPPEFWPRFLDFAERHQRFKETRYEELLFDEMRRKGHLLDGAEANDARRVATYVTDRTGRASRLACLWQNLSRAGASLNGAGCGLPITGRRVRRACWSYRRELRQRIDPEVLRGT